MVLEIGVPVTLAKWTFFTGFSVGNVIMP
jgi:hypothetical protein